MDSTRRFSNITQGDTRNNKILVIRTINTVSIMPDIKRVDMVTNRLYLMAHISTVRLPPVTAEVMDRADMDNRTDMVALDSSGDERHVLVDILGIKTFLQAFIYT